MGVMFSLVVGLNLLCLRKAKFYLSVFCCANYLPENCFAYAKPSSTSRTLLRKILPVRLFELTLKQPLGHLFSYYRGLSP